MRFTGGKVGTMGAFGEPMVIGKWGMTAERGSSTAARASQRPTAAIWQASDGPTGLRSCECSR
jgi:hypothetical protein